MHGAIPLLEDLALVLCVAAVITVLFRRLRQPVVLGYLLAGSIVGPHIAIPLFADLDRIHTLSELGVILVMFSVGLEFSIRRLVRVLPSAGLTGIVQLSVMIWLGFLIGRAFGWTVRESLFGGAAVAISSTMIVARTFAEQKVQGRVVDLVFGVLVVQDLAAVLLLALLTAISSSAGLSGGALAVSVAKLAGFLVAMIVGGFLIVPRAIRMVARLDSPETLVVSSIGLSFAMALIAQKLGYSVALGAFLAGSLVAESGEGSRVEHLVAPVRDVFAGVFFVSVGMIVDPALVIAHWPTVLVLTVVVVVGQVLSVSLGSFLGGNDVRTSIQAGMSLAQIGEFSFIIMGTGLALGSVREFLYPVAVAVAVLTSFTTPWLVRASGRVARTVEHRLPGRVQTFVSLYGGWLERMRSPREPRDARSKLLRMIAIDAVLLAAIAVALSTAMPALSATARVHLGLPPRSARLAVVGAAVLLALPLLVGIVRLSRALGQHVALAAMPPSSEGPDLAAAPRRALVVAIQLGIITIVLMPLVAVTQPFVPPSLGAGVLIVALLAAGFSFWRSAARLQEQVQAGAQTIVQVLARQSRDAPADRPLPVLPGIGDLVSVAIGPDCSALGRTLAEIDLRSLTGATVISITRQDGGVAVPTAREILRAGDVLTLAGTRDAIEAARALLSGVPPAEAAHGAADPSDPIVAKGPKEI